MSYLRNRLFQNRRSGPAWPWRVDIFFYGSFWFNLVCYLLFVPAIHFLQAWTYLKGKSLVAPILIHATYNAFATATGISGFMSPGRPYQMSASDMLTKAGSNALFFSGLLPFAFLLAHEMKAEACRRPD